MSADAEVRKFNADPSAAHRDDSSPVIRRQLESYIPRGLKPGPYGAAWVGTTKVMPFQRIGTSSGCTASDKHLFEPCRSLRPPD